MHCTHKDIPWPSPFIDPPESSLHSRQSQSAGIRGHHNILHIMTWPEEREDLHWSFRCCSRSSLLLLLLICFVHISWSYALAIISGELFCCCCMWPIIIINPITVSRGVVLDWVRYDVTAVDEWTVQTNVHGHHRNLVGFFIPSTQQHSTLESRAMRAHYNLITLTGPHPLSGHS